MTFEQMKKNDICFIHIGLGNVAVAAASVVELPPGCSNKGGQKRRCL